MTKYPNNHFNRLLKKLLGKFKHNATNFEAKTVNESEEAERDTAIDAIYIEHDTSSPTKIVRIGNSSVKLE
jgi:hypothetical protein